MPFLNQVFNGQNVTFQYKKQAIILPVHNLLLFSSFKLIMCVCLTSYFNNLCYEFDKKKKRLHKQPGLNPTLVPLTGTFYKKCNYYLFIYFLHNFTFFGFTCCAVSRSWVLLPAGTWCSDWLASSPPREIREISLRWPDVSQELGTFGDKVYGKTTRHHDKKLSNDSASV